MKASSYFLLYPPLFKKERCFHPNRSKLLESKDLPTKIFLLGNKSRKKGKTTLPLKVTTDLVLCTMGTDEKLACNYILKSFCILIFLFLRQF